MTAKEAFTEAIARGLKEGHSPEVIYDALFADSLDGVESKSYEGSSQGTYLSSKHNRNTIIGQGSGLGKALSDYMGELLDEDANY